MTLEKLLSYLRQHEVHLRLEGERLKYQGPQEVMTPEFVGHLRQHKAELIKLLRRANDENRSAQTVALDSVQRPPANLPLSFAQQSLWFLHRLQPENVSDHLQIGFHIRGQLQIEVLKKSLAEIMSRHEVLRTSFPEMDGKPVQVIHPELSLNMQSQNLKILGKAERDEKIQHIARKEAREPFNLEHGPLWRAKLVRLPDDAHIFLVTMHHIITDGWSFDLFYHELEKLYGAFSSAIPSPLKDLPVQYADYACWQRQWMQNQALETQIAYWEHQLAGSSLVLELPTDRPRPPVQSYGGAKRYMKFSNDLFQGIKALSQNEGCTVFMVLMAAFQLLLYRYTQKEDIIIGVPVADRNLPELQKLIGLFLNMVVMRTDLSGNPDFRSLLARVRNVSLEAFAHQDLPFEKLVEVLQPDRDLSRNPLFQIMFQYSPQGSLNLPGLSVEGIYLDSGTAQFDLSLHLYDTEGGLRGFFEYSTDLFDASTIDRMAGHFQTVLEGIVADPGMRSSDVPMLTDAEREQLLEDFNDTAVDYGLDQCLHQLFEAQVERTPERTALVYENRQLSYRELNTQANRLAHYLRDIGVGPDVPVGICAQRSVEMVVGLYAILKAGGAYVPLDPEYPPERLGFMLEDARVPVILVQKQLIGLLPENDARLVCLDEPLPVADGVEQQKQNIDADENLPCLSTPDHLAYIIFTSGSTGRPKGVMNSHRAICNRLLWMQDEYGLDGSDAVLQKTPYSFDVSVWEFFWPLLSGARLVVARPEGHKDSAYLIDAIGQHQISTIHFVPSMLQIFLQDPGVGSCKSLKRVICSGEALPYELAQRFFDRLKAQLHNLYGPTEAAVDVTFWQCRPDSPLRMVPIGRPVANTQVYILDKHMQPVPIGVPGELHIGGVQVARGYVNRAELTAEKFISDPFSDDPRARLYKTGDLCRYLPDGTIEYLGRNDFQVKIRGFRIEIGEVESVLLAHAGIREAVVLAREDIPGDKRLVAYVVSSQHRPTRDELRSYLKQKLPDYMVPAAFVMLDAFPLTFSGKVDRRALPAPDQLRQTEKAYVAPRNAAEKMISQIWQNVLNIERVGINDNFFDLGGHSLLGVRLFAQIERKWGQKIPLATLYQAPTIKQLAQIIGQKDWKPDWSSLVEIQAKGSNPPLFLIHAAQGNVLLYRELAKHLSPDQPVYGLQSQGLDGNLPLSTCIEDMASHYIAEIQSVQPQGPYHLGGYCLGGGVAYEMAQQLWAQGQQVGLLALFETYNPISIPNFHLFARLIHSGQNLMFHFENMLILKSRDQLRFFSHKARVGKSRMRVSSQLALAKLAHKLNLNNKPHYAHLAVTKVNDKAFLDYTPRRYPGKLTLFRPQRFFLGAEDPRFGWDGMAAGGIDVVELPVNPRGMLVEPFVQLLADNIKIRIHEYLSN